MGATAESPRLIEPHRVTQGRCPGQGFNLGAIIHSFNQSVYAKYWELYLAYDMPLFSLTHSFTHPTGKEHLLCPRHWAGPEDK